jgi:N-acetylglucosamine-6-phosphate deacetylase
MRACGLTDGEYDLGGQKVVVEGRTATTVENNALAGSVTTLADCMRQAVKYGVSLPDALKAVTINPAKSVGIDAQIGSLSIGKRADILVLDKNLQLEKIIFNGKII